MVVRTYPIRVENPPESSSGPMEKEISWAEVSARSGIDQATLEEREKGSVSNKLRRVSEFDWGLLSRSSTHNAPTDIALTFADYLGHQNAEAKRFEQLTEETIRFVEEVEKVASAPVSLIATGFSYRTVIDRRKW